MTFFAGKGKRGGARASEEVRACQTGKYGHGWRATGVAERVAIERSLVAGKTSPPLVHRFSRKAGLFAKCWRRAPLDAPAPSGLRPLAGARPGGPTQPHAPWPRARRVVRRLCQCACVRARSPRWPREAQFHEILARASRDCRAPAAACRHAYHLIHRSRTSLTLTPRAATLLCGCRRACDPALVEIPAPSGHSGARWRPAASARGRSAENGSRACDSGRSRRGSQRHCS